MGGFFRIFTREAGFRLITLIRACRVLRSNPWTRWGVYHITAWWMGRLSLMLGVFIDPGTEMGPGLMIAHPTSIIINRRCRIGANCTISQNTTLGRKSREPNLGYPTIGDRVYIGPGAVIIGAVTVANDAAIGANAVVTKDVPEKGVVVGIPGRVISTRGSEEYVTWQWPAGR